VRGKRELEPGAAESQEASSAVYDAPRTARTAALRF
jgi:hypothetical protein